VEDVVAGVVMAISEVNSNAGLRDVVDVQVELALGVLDEADSSERKKGFGGIRVEQRLHSMEGVIV